MKEGTNRKKKITKAFQLELGNRHSHSFDLKKGGKITVGKKQPASNSQRPDAALLIGEGSGGLTGREKVRETERELLTEADPGRRWKGASPITH